MYVALSVWALSLRIMVSRFIRIVVGQHFIPFYGWMMPPCTDDHILFIHHSSMDTGCFHLTAAVTVQERPWAGRYLLRCLFSILLGVHPGVELLGRLVTLCLTF